MKKDIFKIMEKIENVEEKAEEIIKLLNYESAPISVIDICKEFGFNVYQDDFDSEKVKFISDEVHGYILIDKKLKDIFGTDKIIVVNEKDDVERKRFTIAHELGHYFLEGYLKNGSFFKALEEKNNSSDINEKRVDKFAACLLMPKEIVNEKYNKLLSNKTLNIYEIIDELSRIFAVPSKAMEKRIVEELRLNVK